MTIDPFYHALIVNKIWYIILSPNYTQHQTELETACHGQLIGAIFWAIDERHNPSYGIGNDTIGLVKLSMHSSTYSKVDSYENENKMHILTNY